MRSKLALTSFGLMTLVLLASVACSDDGSAPPKPAAGPEAGEPASKPTPPSKPDESKEKWMKTASGLEYQIIEPGEEGGDSPRTGDPVTVDYKGWLEDGTVFDASANHGGPAEFAVGGLIAGWNEALQLMKTGARWRLRIPPDIGYGAGGSPPAIPPNATLNFELKLHSFKSMPRFVKPNAEAQKATESGLKYEVVKQGAGDAPGEDDAVELKYAFFAPNGTLVDCSESKQNIKARMKELNLAFMKEAIPMLHVGGRLRLEVPPALGFGERALSPDVPPNSTTYWELELVRIIKPLPVPPFETVDETKFAKQSSGMLVQVVKEGTGESPRMGDEVTVHYAGWLTDGTPFDSSYGRGEPATFKVGQVIPGWNEALQTMKPGAVCRLVIPPQLAYGNRDVGDVIKKNSTLVFLVELISFKH